MIAIRATILLIGTLLVGCTSGEDQPTVVRASPIRLRAAGPVDTTREPGSGPGRTDRRRYGEIVAGSHSSYELVSLCRLVRTPDWDGMGLYTVTGLVGYIEERHGRSNSLSSFTYVELELLEPWHKAQKRVVARIPGGRSPEGGTLMWLVSLKVGEQVGLLLGDARADNAGYYDIRELGLFQQRDDGGFTNGQLFTRRRVGADELGRLIVGLAGANPGDPCPYDEVPDLVDSPPAPDENPTGEDLENRRPDASVPDLLSP